MDEQAEEKGGKTIRRGIGAVFLCSSSAVSCDGRGGANRVGGRAETYTSLMVSAIACRTWAMSMPCMRCDATLLQLPQFNGPLWWTPTGIMPQSVVSTVHVHDLSNLETAHPDLKVRR